MSRILRLKITDRSALKEAEADYRNAKGYEAIPFAANTTYTELCEKVIRDKQGEWRNPLYLYVTKHDSIVGIQEVMTKTHKYLIEHTSPEDIDILSINASLDGDTITVAFLVRAYGSYEVPIKGLYSSLDENDNTGFLDQENETVIKGKLVVPEKIRNFKFTEEDIEEHNKNLAAQQTYYENASIEKPFLNSIEHYEPKKLYHPIDISPLIYDLSTFDKNTKTKCSYKKFMKTFKGAMQFANGIEYDSYLKAIEGHMKVETFMEMMEDYINKEFVNNRSYSFPKEDVPTLLKKLHRSLFQLYIVQDIIDDPNVTDINIAGPDVIRARVNGFTYTSNVTFLDVADYIRFINMVVIRNRVNTMLPQQTFTDKKDDDFILRFSLTMDYVNSVEWPYLHIRKVPRHKLLHNELIEKGMLDQKTWDYIVDCARDKRNGGIVFAGPPGSGKTVLLNAILEEAYEDSASILVIQENEELFAEKRKGIMFEHVVLNPGQGQVPVSLEKLGQLALVAGANVFIIGEVKGAEICSAITLANSGCRTALTCHSNSAKDTYEKMTDLALRGTYTSYESAKRSLKSFKTVVYLEEFKVQEISEIAGYDEERHDFNLIPIYKRDLTPSYPPKETIYKPTKKTA